MPRYRTSWLKNKSTPAWVTASSREDWVVKDGYIDLPTKPGLGFDVDEDAAQRTIEYTENLVASSSTHRTVASLTGSPWVEGSSRCRGVRTPRHLL